MQLKSIGVNELHDGSYSVDRKDRYDTYLLLMLKTPALFDFGNGWEEVPETTAVLYAPKSLQRYKPLGKTYIDDWMHIVADEREMERFGVTVNKPLIIRDVERTYTLFRILKEEFTLNGYQYSGVVENLLSALLFKLAETGAYRNSTVVSVANIHKEIRRFPMKEWLLADVARMCALSVSRFEAVYSSEFGISFTADVIQCRIEYAKDLLCTTDLSVKQVSERCGYSGESYFSRQFRKETGMTPVEWRRSH